MLDKEVLNKVEWKDLKMLNFLEMFIENKLITTVLSVFWIVLIINAFNFLDNMDGASAGIALKLTCQ